MLHIDRRCYDHDCQRRRGDVHRESVHHGFWDWDFGYVGAVVPVGGIAPGESWSDVSSNF